MAGAQLRLQNSQGLGVAVGETGPDGSFLLRGNFPSQFTVVARPANSSLDFYADIQQFNTAGHYVVVNVPTTLAHLARESGQSDPEAKVHRLLSLPASLKLELLSEESTVTPFSHLAFFREAEKRGGLMAFYQQLLATPSPKLNSTPPFRLHRSTVKTAFTGLEGGLLALAEKARGGVLVLDSDSEQETLNEFQKFLLESVGSSILDPLIEDCWSWVASQLGFNYGTTDRLKDILSDLSTIETELSDIAQEIQFNNLETQIQDLNSANATPLANLDATLTAFNGSAATNITNTPPAASTDVANLLNSLRSTVTLEDYYSNISNAMLGNSTTNLFFPYQTNTMTNVLGLDTPDRFGKMPLRSYPVNGSILGYLDYFIGYENVALNLLAESTHSSMGSVPPVTLMAKSINEFIPYARKAARLSKLQKQQFAPQCATSDVVIDLEHGLMWYATLRGAVTYDDAIQKCDALLVQDPNTGVIYDDWRLPTYQECKALQTRGRYCSVLDPDVTVNSNNAYDDYGHSAAGLTALGFMNVSQLNFTGDERSGDIWFLALEPSSGGVINQYLYTEFKLNFENNNNENKTSTDKRNFFAVRSIGKPLLDWKLSNSKLRAPFFTTITGSYPSDLLAYNEVQDAEYPVLGVPTSVSLPATVVNGTLQPVVGYDIYLGGEFKVGNADTNQTMTVASAHLTTRSLTLPAVPAYQVPNDSTVSDVAFEVLNTPGSEGLLRTHTDSTTPPGGTLAVNATVKIFDGTTFPVDRTASQSVAIPYNGNRKLRLIQIMERNLNNEDRIVPNRQFQVTGFYDDHTTIDLTPLVTWSISSPNYARNDDIPGKPTIGSGTTDPGLVEYHSFGPNPPAIVNITVNATLPANLLNNNILLQDTTLYQTVTN